MPASSQSCFAAAHHAMESHTDTPLPSSPAKLMQSFQSPPLILISRKTVKLNKNSTLLFMCSYTEADAVIERNLLMQQFRLDSFIQL